MIIRNLFDFGHPPYDTAHFGPTQLFGFTPLFSGYDGSIML